MAERKIILNNQGFTGMLTASPPATIAVLGVIGALSYGLKSMMGTGNGITSNKMMRMRVLGQASVLGILALYPIYSYTKKFFNPTTTTEEQ